MLWKTKWRSSLRNEPDLCVVLTTVDSSDPKQEGTATWGPAHFDMVIKKSTDFHPGTTMFNDQNKLRIGPGSTPAGNEPWSAELRTSGVPKASGYRFPVKESRNSPSGFLCL